MLQAKFMGINSKMNVPRVAAVVLILQLECQKQLLIYLTPVKKQLL